MPINPTFKTSPFQVDDIDDGDENSGSNDDEDGSSENDMRADEEAWIRRLGTFAESVKQFFIMRTKADQ